MSDPDASSSELSESAPSIEVLAESVSVGIDPARLSHWVRRLTKDVVPDASSFVVRLSDTATVQEINRRFRDKDAPTDVLSFPGDETPEGRHLGDVVIAVPIAERQAAEAGHPVLVELKTLIIHGLLHCMGFDHETDQGEMEERERDLRDQWTRVDA